MKLTAGALILTLSLAARAGTVEIATDDSPMPAGTTVAPSVATPAPLAPAWTSGLALIIAVTGYQWLRRRHTT